MPSSIRETERGSKKMKEWWLAQSNDEQAGEIVPVTLKEQNIIDDNSTYIEFDKKNCTVKSSADCSTKVDDAIKHTLVPSFVVSLIRCDSNYVFVTQFETYFRNNTSIVASAISTIHEPYHDAPSTFIKEKNEKGNTWFELSIYYKRYEILVTGGIPEDNHQHPCK
ncbi:hypothetical protein RMCBS344292_17932 [Rhizopus microsporus]|nr:hypothetical protein RMCBS344292_17932 [Rhizopus microsporus]